MTLEVGAATASRTPAETIAYLRNTFSSGRTRGLDWRREQLNGLLRMLAERGEDLAAAVEADLRRARLQSLLLDVGPVRAEVEHALRNLANWTTPQQVSTHW